MKRKIRKDYILRQQYKNTLIKRKCLKIIINDQDYNIKLRKFAWIKLDKITKSKKLSKVFLHNFCIKTGRAKGVFRLLKLCRHSIRRQANKGNLFGITKL